MRFIKKKWRLFLIIATFLTAGLYLNRLIQAPFTGVEKGSCPFCNDQILSVQEFYREGTIIALVPHKPIVKGHALIMPERHVSRFEDLSAEEISDMGEVIKKVHRAEKKLFDATDYLLLQKNGREAGQTVYHTHMHYIPRNSKIGIASFVIRMIGNLFNSPDKKEQIFETAISLKDEIEPSTSF